jgi:prepilin-type N-terminal cleavage/methylation domain-containing protein
MKAPSSAPAVTLSRAEITRGFTLIELLTVIAIIGILAAILIPTVSKVRESARKSKSISNLHAIYTAMLAYADDNKQKIVQVNNPDGTWGQHLSRANYFATRAAITQVTENPLMGCPQHLAAIPEAIDGTSKFYTYAMNASLAQPKRFGAMLAPSRTALVTNGVWLGTAFSSNMTFTRYAGNQMRTAPCKPPMTNSVFVLFCGGNVSIVDIDTIPKDNTSEAGKFFWAGL